MRYFRGRFMIGVYALKHEGETLLALCDNIREFASYLNRSEEYARITISQIETGYKKFIKLNGKLRTVELIEVED